MNINKIEKQGITMNDVTRDDGCKLLLLAYVDNLDNLQVITDALIYEVGRTNLITITASDIDSGHILHFCFFKGMALQHFYLCCELLTSIDGVNKIVIAHIDNLPWKDKKLEVKEGEVH